MCSSDLDGVRHHLPKKLRRETRRAQGDRQLPNAEPTSRKELKALQDRETGALRTRGLLAHHIS